MNFCRGPQRFTISSFYCTWDPVLPPTGVPPRFLRVLRWAEERKSTVLQMIGTGIGDDKYDASIQYVSTGTGWCKSKLTVQLLLVKQ